MKKIVYMDGAASWLKPESVIGAEKDFLTNRYANAGRGVCERAGMVDNMVADARKAMADFIGAKPKNIVWTSGATDGLNRVVNIITGQKWYSPKFVFAVSDLDHHSARCPWENLLRCGKIAKEIVCDLDSDYNINIDNVPKTDILIITAMSNVLGIAQDVGAIVRAARTKNPNVITIVDASQYIVHKKINVKEWDCDFMVCSGHKFGADTGVGVLYIRDPEKYYPDKFGGGMINKIRGNSDWVFNDAPEKFEAGTLPLTQIIGVPYALEYLSGWSNSEGLIAYMYDELLKIDKIQIVTRRNASLLSFVVNGMSGLDFGLLMGIHNICLRVGNMCASWIHKKLGVNGTIRISVGPWNTIDDAKYVVEAIRKVVK